MFKLDVKLFVSIIIIIIIGPLTSWLILKSSKKKSTKIIDSCIIASFQLILLLVLLFIITIAKPLVLIFEVDRLKVITYSDIPKDYLAYTPDWFTPWRFSSKEIPIMGLKELNNIDNKIESVEKALQGVDAGQDPKRWIGFDDNVKDRILLRALSISILLEKYPQASPLVEKIINGNLERLEDAQWLPIVSRHTYDWVVILHPSNARVLGIIPFDGFIN